MVKVLIGGEHNGLIRDAFTALGHDATSCDFRPSVRPGKHHQGDWRDIMNDGFDLGIFHPTCTFMTWSSAKHLYIDGDKRNGIDFERFNKMLQEAWDLYEWMSRCTIPYVAIENPKMLQYAQIMSQLNTLRSQTVHPWYFGTDPKGPDNVTKATTWWLKGDLPKLKRTGTLTGKTARPDVHYLGPQGDDPEDRRMMRSRFHPGHAWALATQWGGFVQNQVGE